MNPSDPHHSVEQIECDGKMRDMVMGSTIVKGEKNDPNLPREIFALEPQIQAAIASLSLSEKTHWFKIVYSQMNNELVISEVTMDNQGHDELTNAIRALNWPKKKDFYMTKQFIIVKPFDESG